MAMGCHSKVISANISKPPISARSAMRSASCGLVVDRDYHQILGALPVMAAQSKSAEGDAPATLLDTLQAADNAVDANIGVQEVQQAVNTGFLNRLSFVGDELTATLGLGAKGSFDQNSRTLRTVSERTGRPR